MSLDLTTKLHQAAFQAGQPQSVYALLDFQPAATIARMPLDLRLVLDISASMSDQANPGDRATKLALLRDAVAGMMEDLQPGDHVKVVPFDDKSRVAYEGVIRTDADKQKAIAKVLALHTSGGTSILAGLECGLKEAALPGHVARVVLVTDGEGAQREEPDCERLAFDQRGKSTWLVYGIGIGYNDAFLDALARANGGQYVHLSNMQTAVAQFAAEMRVMGEIALTNLVVTLEPVPGVELVKVDRIVPQTLALPVHMPTFLSADLGDVDKARGQKLLVQLSVPALGVGDQPLLRVRCGFHVPALKLLNQQRDLLVTATFAAEAAGPDGEVLRTVQLAGATRLATLGLAEAASGAGDAAVRTLGSAAGLYDALGMADMSAKLVTLSSGLAGTGAVDEDVKRTLTTMSRQAWQQGGGNDPLP
ncbi:MAG: von Willebrand factor, type [Cyanobacteria bacterium RYN_339]|nr:von Willebrand factor, type [Cyanobacteria bacterium RYN_339]